MAKSSIWKRVDQGKRRQFKLKQHTREEFERLRKFSPRLATYTYFAQDQIRGLIKIGMTIDPSRRIQELGASGFYQPKLVLLLRGGALEGCYHQFFAEHRHEGEWFLPHADIIAEIERLRPESDPGPYMNGPMKLADLLA